MSDLSESKPAKAFLDILLENHSRWMTRADLCEALHATRFTSYWTQAIDALVDSGQIQRKESKRGTFQTVYMYRISEAQE